jgi:hypothetical protein
MKTYTIENTTSGHVIGDFDGETREHAIAAMLRDAGYRADVVDGDVQTDCPNWNGGADLAATERAAVSYEIVSAKPNGHVGERILFSTRERAGDELTRLAVAFGCDESDLRIVERVEAPDVGF